MTVRATEHPHEVPIHPVWKEAHDRRHESMQLRMADRITSFAGSMRFVYIHVVWFSIWVVLNKVGATFDPFPFGLLTMIVSLEAIFLSTFVMISQNRADEKRQAMANHEWELVQTEDKQNRELLDLSRQILDLTKQVHQLMGAGGGGRSPKTAR
jgi:uncharacterized membrane protein